MPSLCGALFAVFLSTPAWADSTHDFFHAVQFDDVSTVQEMLADGVSPNLQEPGRGENALIVALREESMRVFKLLLETKSVELELAARNGDTALMIAAYKRNMPAVRSLLARGARVNRPGWTALHYAAASGDADIVRLLFEHHANLNARSPTDLTALMLAAREGSQYAAQALLDLGADATAIGGTGISAADMADQADKPIIAAAIRAHIAAHPHGKTVPVNNERTKP
jgi:ankyrin repeat protein